MANTVLILGSSGKFGRHCAQAFDQAGWRVKRFQRGKQNMNDAAKGVGVIVNGLNPPNYANWQTVLPAIINDVISAAQTSGATILQPANVYNFGDTGGVWGKAAVQNSVSNKGQVRIDIEKTLSDAAQNHGVQTILLRCGDFIDTTNSGNWFDIALASKIDKGRFVYPGRCDIPHAWGYLPDIARAAVQLCEKRAALSKFEDVSFGGHTLTGVQIKHCFEHILGRQLTQKTFQWSVFRMLSPFWKFSRELLEMQYLWNTPHSLDNERLLELLPNFEVTELESMLRAAIDWKISTMPNLQAQHA